MKQLFLFLALILSTFTMQAQFNVQSGTKTETVISIEDQSFDVYETKNHSPYIVCHSPKTDNDYAVWIGEETDKTFDNKPVRMTKSGKYFILIISKNSKNPYPKYISLENS